MYCMMRGFACCVVRKFTLFVIQCKIEPIRKNYELICKINIMSIRISECTLHWELQNFAKHWQRITNISVIRNVLPVSWENCTNDYYQHFHWSFDNSIAKNTLLIFWDFIRYEVIIHSFVKWTGVVTLLIRYLNCTTKASWHLNMVEYIKSWNIMWQLTVSWKRTLLLILTPLLLICDVDWQSHRSFISGLRSIFKSYE